MTTLINDRDLEKELRRQRARSGGDRFDEVWDGVYMMNPLPNSEHQRIVTRLASALDTVIAIPGLGTVYAGINVSDREHGWKKNYRCPDVAVFLNGNPAKDLGTHHCGGPDFLIEVLSPGDRSLKKFSFYAQVGVREALIIKRRPWRLTLYRLTDGQLRPAAVSTPEESQLVKSEIVSLGFRLIKRGENTRVEAIELNGERRWVCE